MDYEPVQYPKWKYHKTKPPVVVNDPAEEKKLGPAWQDRPYPQQQEEAK